MTLATLPAPSRDSSSLKLGAGHHRILVKFTADAAPLSVALHPRVPPQVKKSDLPEPLANIRAGAGCIFPR